MGGFCYNWDFTLNHGIILHGSLKDEVKQIETAS